MTEGGAGTCVARCEEGYFQWRRRHPPIKRPLYGLDRLADRPEAPVIVTEGEKAADAAHALFPDYVAITSSGGAYASEPQTGRHLLAGT